MAHPVLRCNNCNCIRAFSHHRKRFPSRQGMDIPTDHLHSLLGLTAVVARSPNHAVLAVHTQGITSLFEGAI